MSECGNAADMPQGGWEDRVDRVLRLHIGLIDPELCEAAARFLVREDWLIKDKPELENRVVLLIAKAIGQNLPRTSEPEHSR